MGALKKAEAQSACNVEFEGKSLSLPVSRGTEGEQAIDVGSLQTQVGLLTMDHGFGNTAGCESAITFLDGERGVLRYRGYDIAELAEHCDFETVIYLLIHGELPNSSEMAEFNKLIRKHQKMHAGLSDIVRALPKNLHPMAALSMLTLAVSGMNLQTQKPVSGDRDKHEAMALALATMPMLAAHFHRHRSNQQLLAPRHDFSISQNFYYLMFGEAPDAKVKKAIDQLFILHADHEQNCSTATVRTIASAKTGLFACLSGGINALWGSAHGGANQAVVEMLLEIERSGGDFNKAVARAKDKDDSFRLMGFGHRIYKNFDPRATIIKAACENVLKSLDRADPLLDIAKGLESAALRDEYFLKRRLYPNVDFYSGIIYRAMDIPVDMFTVMFAIGRLPGWLAHWHELTASGEVRITRPRQLYVGKGQRNLPNDHKRKG